jgi:hypothetical protein
MFYKLFRSWSPLPDGCVIPSAAECTKRRGEQGKVDFAFLNGIILFVYQTSVLLAL